MAKLRAGGNRPRQTRPIKQRFCDIVRSGVCSEGSFTHESCQRIEVAPDIGQHDQGSAAWEAKEGETFQAPGLEGGVASFRGIARTVVEGFPHGAAYPDITHQADGTIGKALAHIADEAGQ